MAGRGLAAPAPKMRNPLQPKPHAFSREGEERHLPVHGGRAVAARAVRAQAAAHGTERPADPGELHGGQAVRLHGQQPPQRTCSARSAASSSTASPAPGSAICCRTPPASWTSISIVTTCKTDLFNHAPAKLFMNTGSGLFGRPEHGLVGHLRPRQRMRRSARLRRAAKRPARSARRGGALGQRRSAHDLSGRAAAQSGRSDRQSLHAEVDQRRRSSASSSMPCAS